MKSHQSAAILNLLAPWPAEDLDVALDRYFNPLEDLFGVDHQ